ncbi:MIP family channel protein [Streptomyces sp. SL13]|uniref:MIP family channel protein n=1 Tax=Streptantibioticus silvisoli TaxID=2705255 RepID=A0AA90K165_9ACTN|nr:MIP family channel protein [Streptantibioticus silvisoli]MDI5973616.1 MIP family channel protein [Streptantibioticus silvisoli]
MDRRTIVSEFVGTLLYVFFAVGSLVVAAQYVGAVGVALTFGLVLVGLAYVFGAISGCHLNPAVTLGALLARRMSPMTAIGYWVAQFVGAIAGAALLLLLAKQIPGLRTDGAFGSNGYGTRSAVGINTGGAFLIEVAMTFLLVLVYLAVTRKVALNGFGALAVGLTLAVVHLIGIPLTGTGVNPARSLGPAVFAGGAALSQLWLFIVAPLVGGILAALVSMLTHPHGAVPVVNEGQQGPVGGLTGDDTTGTGTGTGVGAGTGTGATTGPGVTAGAGGGRRWGHHR